MKRKKMFIITTIAVFSFTSYAHPVKASLISDFNLELKREISFLTRFVESVWLMLSRPTQYQKENNVFYLVSEVVDGDTIKVIIDGQEYTLRLLGIDTPETKDPRKDVQCFGVDAANKAKNLMESEYVRLESDPTQSDKDQYGRLLRYVYLEDGTFINSLLIEQGYAFSYREYPTQKLEEFNRLEEQARVKSLGLWSSCPIQ